MVHAILYMICHQWYIIHDMWCMTCDLLYIYTYLWYIYIYIHIYTYIYIYVRYWYDTWYAIYYTRTHTHTQTYRFNLRYIHIVGTPLPPSPIFSWGRSTCPSACRWRRPMRCPPKRCATSVRCDRLGPICWCLGGVGGKNQDRENMGENFWGLEIFKFQTWRFWAGPKAT